MARNNSSETVWEYIDWLYNTNRLTTQEHLDLKRLVLELEVDTMEEALEGKSSHCDGCEQGYGCEYPDEGC